MCYFVACCSIKCIAQRQQSKKRQKKKRKKHGNGKGNEHLCSHLLECDGMHKDESDDVLHSLPNLEYKRMTLGSLTHVSEEQSTSSLLKWNSTYTPTTKGGRKKTQSWVKYLNLNKSQDELSNDPLSGEMTEIRDNEEL